MGYASLYTTVVLNYTTVVLDYKHITVIGTWNKPVYHPLNLYTFTNCILVDCKYHCDRYVEYTLRIVPVHPIHCPLDRYQVQYTPCKR